MTPLAQQVAPKIERKRSHGAHPPTPSSGSVTNLIYQVKEGNSLAAQKLFTRYCRRLLALARTKLKGNDLRIANEDDVVNSAFAGFFLGAERGQYTRLHDRDDLWHLLVKITIRKAQRLIREQTRKKRLHRGGQGSARRLRVDVPVEQVPDRRPSPDLEVLAKETIEHLLGRLGSDRLRAIAVWKWEGYSNNEIASMLDCCSRAVERKLKLIRTIWSEEGRALGGRRLRGSHRARVAAESSAQTDP